MDPTAFLRDASGHAEGGASGHAYRSTCSWGPTGRTQWTPCGLQSRSVENQRHVYCGSSIPIASQKQQFGRIAALPVYRLISMRPWTGVGREPWPCGLQRRSVGSPGAVSSGASPKIYGKDVSAR